MEHRLIIGGEHLLPFARNCVTKLKKLGIPYANQSFEVEGASIKVRIEPGHEYIKIEGGGHRYQFFVSDPQLKLGITAEGRRVVRGHVVSIPYEKVAKTEPPKITPKARGSSVAASAEDATPSWRLFDIDKLGDAFPFKNAFQAQAISEYEFYRKTASGLSSAPLVSSWASSTQVENLSAYGGIRRNELLAMSIDIEYDMPTTRAGKWHAPDADWYKRGAIRTVESVDFGSRTFYLMTDISNVIHVYPAGTSGPLPSEEEEQKSIYSREAIKTTVPERFVKRVNLPLPAWARKASMASRDAFNIGGVVSVENLSLNAPQYRWAFNSAADKMCSVVYEDLPNADGMPFMDLEGREHATHEALPGLVEFSLAIELTGPNLEDFTVGATTAQELRPSLTGRYIVGADYAWAIPGATSLDDIVLLEIEVFHSAAAREKGYDITMDKCLAKISNFSSPALLRTFVIHSTNQPFYDPRPGGKHIPTGDTQWHANSSLLAYDLRSLAFVVCQKYLSSPTHLVTPPLDPAFMVVEPWNSTAAMRLQCYMRNTLEKETVMSPGTAMDVGLVAAHADLSTGVKMAITERDTLGSDRAFHGLRFGAYADQYTIGSDVDVDVGALLYSYRLLSFFDVSGGSQFAVHPSGSWSISTPFMAYYEGVGGVGPGVPAFNIDKMRSARLDIASFRDRPDGRETRRTHLEMFNFAFGNTYAESDFLPEFSELTVNGIDYCVDAKSRLAFDINTYPLSWNPRGGNGQVTLGYLTGTEDPVPKISILGGSALFF